MKTRARSFSSVGKVSRGALVFGGILAGLSVAAAVAASRTGTGGDRAGAIDAGRRVQVAAEAWQSENADGCPTITELMDEGRLDSDAPTDDPWGNRYRIICNGPHAVVRSAGPDRRPGTADDVTIGRADS